MYAGGVLALDLLSFGAGVAMELLAAPFEATDPWGSAEPRKLRWTMRIVCCSWLKGCVLMYLDKTYVYIYDCNILSGFNICFFLQCWVVVQFHPWISKHSKRLFVFGGLPC